MHARSEKEKEGEREREKQLRYTFSLTNKYFNTNILFFQNAWRSQTE